MQQFASRVYGPVVSEGLAAWHGRDGNYWGHNAIIRVKAFADSAGLPELSGRRPFGGHVLSHDFVEAALMRRAGWAVYMVPELEGSYEECPPTLIELASRDRRWCQGNLQHLKIIGGRGLSWVSRLHLLQGIMSYLASPLWLAFLLLGLGLSAQAQYIRPEYFPDGFALFPRWPVFDPERALRLLLFTMSVLLLPKVLAVTLALGDAKLRRGCGGATGLIASLVGETLMSILVSPVTMMIQSRFVADVLAGRDSGWANQNRSETGVSLRTALKWHWSHVAAGTAIGLSAFVVSWHTFLWLLPLSVGLMLSAAVSWATASSALGLKARRLGIFLTPEESSERGDGARQVREAAPQPAE
jgi:membrane glycosyltransferase